MTTTRRQNGSADKTGNTSPTNVSRDDVARRAYARYEERGREPGHDVDDWLQAERDLKQRSSD